MKQNKKEKLPVWKPLAWSSRAVSLSMNVILMGYLTFYCTDMLGLSALVVGTVMLLSKLVDGFTDLIVGFIIEKTHTKWGKARPYELFILGLWLFTILLFRVPESLSVTGKYIYIFVLFFLANSVCYTLVSGNETIYLVRAFPKKEDQISLLSVNGSIVMIIAIVFNIVFPNIIKTVGTTADGWSKIAIFMGIPLALIGLLRFVFIHEVVTEQEEKAAGTAKEKTARTLSLKEMLSLMVKNKYIWLLVGMVLIINFISNMSVVTTYYFKYIVGDIGLQSIPALASGLTGLIMGLAGYQGTAQVQTITANRAIVILYNWIPIVLLAAALVLAGMWKLGKIMPQIQEDLAKKRKEQV